MVYRKKPSIANLLTSKKTLLYIALGLVLLTAVIFVFRNYKKPAGSPVLIDNSTAEETPKIDLSPATEEDKKEVDQHKQEITPPSATPPATNGSPNKVTPIITQANFDQSSNSVVVRSFISSIVEDSGTCTLTITKDSLSVSTQGIAAENVSQTVCAPLSIDRGKIPSAGIWKVSISYTSTKSEGTSTQDISVEVK